MGSGGAGAGFIRDARFSIAVYDSDRGPGAPSPCLAVQAVWSQSAAVLSAVTGLQGMGLLAKVRAGPAGGWDTGTVPAAARQGYRHVLESLLVRSVATASP